MDSPEARAPHTPPPTYGEHVEGDGDSKDTIILTTLLFLFLIGIVGLSVYFLRKLIQNRQPLQIAERRYSPTTALYPTAARDVALISMPMEAGGGSPGAAERAGP